jgi:CheY-like chemotaxis protein
MRTREIGVRPLVLLVNPDADMRDLYGDWFVSLGFELVCAADALIAVVIARAYQPELIVTELRLRRSDGLFLIRQLRANAVTGHLPILVITRTTQPQTLQEATAAGAIAVFPALTDFDRVRNLVATIASRVPAVPAQRRRALPWGAILHSSITNESAES